MEGASITLLKMITSLGAIVYDVFFVLGKFALCPISELASQNISYINPISNVNVSVSTDNFIVRAVEVIADFFDNNFIFTYDSWFSDNLNLLMVIIGLIVTVMLIKLAINFIALFIPD